MSDTQALALERIVLGSLRNALNAGSDDQIAEARQMVREFYEALWG